MGFSGGSDDKGGSCNVGRPGLDAQVGENPLEENNPTHPEIFCLDNPVNRGSWWAAVHAVAKS